MTFPQQVLPRSPARSFIHETPPNPLDLPLVLDPTAASDATPVQAQPLRDTQLEEDLELHVRAELPPAGAPWPQVADYEILEVLGEGGMGVVFKARQRSLKRLVALKMTGNGYFSPGTRRRFQIEAETIARLHHPNIVQIYEVGEHEGRPYLALECVEGGTLAQYLVESGPMPVRQAVALAMQLAQAMQYAHEKGVIHRDLKPANILLQMRNAEGEMRNEPEAFEFRNPHPDFRIPKITDFGLAKMLDEDQSRTRTGAILGTPAYMAPEQARGQTQAIGPQADVYSLGAILYEMLTGQPPFSSQSSWELLNEVVHAEPQRPSRKRARLARDLDTICLKALAKDPRQRYATAGALAADLQRFLAGESIEARPERPWRPLARRIRKHPVLLAVLLLLTGMLAWATGCFLQQRAEAKQALREGRQLRHGGDWENAMLRLEQGHERVRLLPCCAELDAQLLREWNSALRDQFAFRLHELAEELRFCRDPESLPRHQVPVLARRFRDLWQARERLLVLSEWDDNRGRQKDALLDLYDVAVLGLSLELYLAEQPEDVEQVHRDGMQIVRELEQHQVPVAALAHERRYHAEKLGLPVGPEAESPATSAWDHYLVGRLLQSTGQWDEARQHLRYAIQLDAGRAIFYFEAGICALRQAEYAEACREFTVYIALKTSTAKSSPHTPRGPAWEGYYNRGLAEMALQQWKDAEADFTEAVCQNPDFAAAYLNRGAVLRERGRGNEALQDLQCALDRGAAPAKVHYNLALAYWDAGDLHQAFEQVRQARHCRDCPVDAARLEAEIQKKLNERDSNGQ
ncbi:MAG TPA: serine/threonine-protein kinase [Gemmataceae bacterium]|nr:serine/threonine-protein kinase [Gemmataceae bacterium]